MISSKMIPIHNNFISNNCFNSNNKVPSPCHTNKRKEILIIFWYLQELHYATAAIPEMVKNFITYFHANILDGNVSEMHSMYETSFNRITEKLYQKQPWPQPEAIAPLVEHDPVFTILYKELYYRHIYAKLTPSFEDRFNSFQNYCELFNYILSPLFFFFFFWL